MDIYREAATLLFGFLLLVAALNSLIKLSESVLSMLSDFESMVQKNSSKSIPTGDGIHDLTLHMMNYLSLITDYSNVLVDISTDWPSSANHPIQNHTSTTPSSTNLLHRLSPPIWRGSYSSFSASSTTRPSTTRTSYSRTS
ncbi:hypothetical protein EV2_011229 [Malus domestica]